MVPLDQLEDFQGELKTLEVKQYEKLKQGMIRDGFHTSIDVWKKPGDKKPRKMLDGHQRVRALRQMLQEGFELEGGKLPVDWVIAKTEKQAKRMILEKMSQFGRYSEDSIYEFMSMADLEWPDVKSVTDFPTINMGKLEKGWFDDHQIDDKAEEVPTPPKVPVTKLGDVWEMGSHRLVCGDSRDPHAVGSCIAANATKAGLLNTDPPYGVNYDKTSDDPRNKIENDNLDGEALQEFLVASLKSALPFMTNNPAFYLWHPMLTQGTFFAAAAAADILIHRQIIWVKPSLIMGHGDYHWRHELCFYGWIKGRRCPWYGARNQDTVWSVKRENAGVHPTQKPVQLFSTPILNHLKDGEQCLDLFAGSGTQFIAAEALGRICGGVEINPVWCDVIVERWENYSGGKAKRQTSHPTKKNKSNRKARPIMAKKPTQRHRNNADS